MIEITTDEALQILTVLNKLEGFLYNVRDSSQVIELVDYPVKILSDKINLNSKNTASTPAEITRY